MSRVREGFCKDGETSCIMKPLPTISLRTASYHLSTVSSLNLTSGEECSANSISMPYGKAKLNFIWNKIQLVTLKKHAMAAVLLLEVWFLEGKWECAISSNKFRSSVRWQLPKEPFPSDSLGVIWGSSSYQIQLDNLQTVYNRTKLNFDVSVVKPILNCIRAPPKRGRY